MRKIICPYCNKEVEIIIDELNLIYDYCNNCGKIVTGEVLENGEVEFEWEGIL